MYVCMFVCMCLCTNVCKNECMCVCVCILVFMYIYMCLFVCIYVWMYVCTYEWMFVWMNVCLYVCIYVQMYEWRNVCTYVSVFLCLCIYVCNVCMYVCMYVCLFTWDKLKVWDLETLPQPHWMEPNPRNCRGDTSSCSWSQSQGTMPRFADLETHGLQVADCRLTWCHLWNPILMPWIEDYLIKKGNGLLAETCCWWLLVGHEQSRTKNISHRP